MVINGKKVSIWIILVVIFCFYRTYAENITVEDPTTTEKESIVAEESKDDKTIIKQINKQNDDGTYTFGYEADDGTFKYESRDVLGNIKGTFGYIDNDGIIKRVSYTTNDNETSTESLEEVVSTIKPNNTRYTGSTTRRPYPQVSTVKSNVIQSIPRRKLSDLTKPLSSSTQSPKVVYATSIPSSTPRIVMPSSPHTRPILQNGVFVRSTTTPQNQEKFEGQIVRPSIQTDSSTVKPVTEGNYVRRVLVSRQPVVTEKTSTESQVTSSTSRPNLDTNQFLDNESTTTTHKSNTFRRQLSPEKGYDPHQHILNFQQSAGDDTTDIYGGSVMTGTQRPLFTTTQNSRTSNSGRHAILRNGHYIPIGYHRNNIPRHRQDPLIEAPTTQPSTEESYQTQTTIPVISIPEYAKDNLRYPQYTRPTLNSVVKNHNHNYLREDESQIVDPQTSYTQQNPESDQYLRESTSQTGPVQFPENSPSPQAYRTRKSRPIPQSLAQYQGEYPDPNYQTPVHIPIPIPQQNYRGGYGNEIANNIPEDIQPPVTNKDFQRLLNQLIYLQTKLQQLTQIAQYQQEIINNQRQPTYPQYYQQGVAPRNPHYRQYERHPQPRNRYLPGYQQEQPDYGDPTLQYDPRYNPRRLPPQHQGPYENQDYLPPEVREMLLLRMLQLAINSEIAATNQMEVIAKSPTKNAVSSLRKDYQNHHPVHNVQILGEESNTNSERLKPTARSKRFKDPDEDMDYYE